MTTAMEFLDTIASFTVEFATKNQSTLLFTGLGISWVFALVIVTRCRFMTADELDYGLFKQPYFGGESGEEFLGCVPYIQGGEDDHEDDSGLRAGRSMAVFTVLFTSVSVLCAVSATLAPKEDLVLLRRLWKVTHGCVAVAAVSQMLVFVALSSKLCSTGCTLTGVGQLSIWNTMLLDVLTLTWFFVPLPSSQWIRWYDASKMRTKSGNVQPQDRSIANDTVVHYNRNDLPDEKQCDESIISDHSCIPQEKNDILGNVQDLLSFRLATATLTVIAWVVSLVGIRRCTFLEAPTDIYQSSFAALGLFSQAVYDEGTFLGCVSYPPNVIGQFDSAFRTARAFGTMTTMLTTGYIFLFAIQFVSTKLVRQCWYALRVLIPMAMCTQLVTLAVFDSNVCHFRDEGRCRFGATGMFVILNILLMAILSAVVLIVPAPIYQVFIVSLSCHDASTRNDERLDTTKLRSTPSEELKIGRRNTVDTTNFFTNTDNEAIATQQTKNRLLHTFHAEPSEVESITYNIEFTDTGKRIVKVVTHMDGSKTTSTKELNDQDALLADEMSAASEID